MARGRYGGFVLYDRIEKLRERRMSTPGIILLPPMMTDIETVFDILDVIGKRWQGTSRDQNGMLAEITHRLYVTSGEVSRSDLADLSVHERNSLNAIVEVGNRSLILTPSLGHLHVSPDGDRESTESEREAIRILLQGSSRRPAWSRMLWWLPLIPALLVTVGGAWLLFSAPVTPGAALAGIGAGVLLLSFAISWSVRLRNKYLRASGPIRFRAQSRQETYASRADRFANLKVALITAPVSIIAALVVAWATGFIAPK